MSASIRRVQHILRWFESQHQLTFYASSLLFVYEGLHSSSSSSTLSSHLSSPAISLSAGKIATLSSADDSSHVREGRTRQEAVGKKEEVAEYNNNNNIQVSVPWDYSLATIYTNQTKGGHHHCAKVHLHSGSIRDNNAMKVRQISGDKISALYDEDNSVWKRTGEQQQPPNGNGNKSQLEGNDEDEERKCNSYRRREEEEEGEEELKGQGDDATEGSGVDREVEVRMIDFAHVFQSESPDYGYIFGLKHLLTVLEQILCEAN